MAWLRSLLRAAAVASVVSLPAELGSAAVPPTAAPAPAPAAAADPAARPADAGSPQVLVADLQGAVSPASAAYFLRVIDQAARQRAALVVFRIDTPGGLDSSMREIIRAILASPVPIAIYVAPSGARAASAGTYLIYAAHVAAMAPGTNLGAATPVQIGIGGERGTPLGGDRERDKTQDGKAKETSGDAKPGKTGGEEGREAMPDAMSAKATNDAAAYLRSLAQLRGRNAEWAEQAVRKAVSLSADEALSSKVVDLLAADVADLLAKADGRAVKVGDREQRLALADARTVVVETSWKERLLARIADPNVALILMMLGVYGLLFEFYSPGMAAPGVIGGICLLLGLYGMALLPVDFAGVALVLLGLALMIGEAFLPSFGIVGMGGVVAFVAGAMMLVDADVPGFTVALQVVVPLAVVSAVTIALLGAMALKSRGRPVVSGREAMIGAPVVAIDAFPVAGDEGWVAAWGERWRARAEQPMADGAAGRVLAIDGLTLVVGPEAETDKGGPR